MTVVILCVRCHVTEFHCCGGVNSYSSYYKARLAILSYYKARWAILSYDKARLAILSY